MFVLHDKNSFDQAFVRQWQKSQSHDMQGIAI